MSNVRWETKFPYSLAFNLFKQHLEEINRSYWAFVPAYNTIVKIANGKLNNDDANPRDFFMVPDEEDRRLAQSYGEWKIDFKEYANYSRLSFVMLISSCFETYLRTIVSLSFESKPGVIIDCADAVDGASLLKKDIQYGNINSKSYRFSKEIDEICRGEWRNRFDAFEKYFGELPQELLDLTGELDELRVTRNNLGHYFGRKRDEYSAPIDFKPISVSRVSHKKILKYYKLIYDVAKMIDGYLYRNIIGSYDIIKKYFNAISEGEIVADPSNPNAYQLRKLIGSQEISSVGKKYYEQLTTYCEVNYIELETDCIFTKQTCVYEVNRRLREKGVEIQYNGRKIELNQRLFGRLLEKESLLDNENYAKRNVDNNRNIQYLYSAALIKYITKKLELDGEDIITELKNKE
ncbi:hypothetical protein [Clostridium sp.]